MINASDKTEPAGSPFHVARYFLDFCFCRNSDKRSLVGGSRRQNLYRANLIVALVVANTIRRCRFDIVRASNVVDG